MSSSIPSIEVEWFEQINGDALVFWNTAWAAFVDRGMTDHTSVPTPLPITEAWVARIDGEVVGIQAAAPMPQSQRVNHVLSWVHPDHRGKGVWTRIAEVMDANLRGRGFTFYLSWIVADEPEMLSAVLNRGGVIQQYRTRRPILGGE